MEVKILSLIQSWAHAFSVDPELQGVAELYLELKKKGISSEILLALDDRKRNFKELNKKILKLSIFCY